MAGELITPEFLAMIDQVRSIPGKLGVHTWSVTMVRQVYDRDPGQPHGRLTKLTVETPITVGDGYAPHVEQLTAQDIVSSGGFYKTGDYRIGPLTPEYTTDDGSGGTAVTDIDPALGTVENATDFRLTGPGIRSGGELFKKIKTETNKSTSYYIVVRRTGT